MKKLKLKSYQETLFIIRSLAEKGVLTKEDISLLLGVFDNERPDYALGQKLEIGGILLSLEEIEGIVKQQALTLQSEIKNEKPVVFFWSKWSSEPYVQQLSGFLAGIVKNEVKDIGIKTHWLKEGVVAIEEKHMVLPNKDDLVYCVDFLVGSGGTLMRMYEVLACAEIAARKTLVIIDKPTPCKVFRPILVDPYVTIEDDYWTFGYGSDAKVDGVEVGRSLPFLACLMPLGQGIRDKLQSDFLK